MRIQHAGIILKKDSDKARRLGQTIADWFVRHRIRADLDHIEPNQDIVVILGGDGTLLHVADQASSLGIPVVGINLGDLGFLTEVAVDEWDAALQGILDSDLRVEERMMLRLRLHSGQECSDWQLALNDVVISKGNVDRLVRLSAWLGEEFITTYRADGLVIATPTGSTAYNLSAGGPIVHPGLRAVVISPICPFMLESRPVLLPVHSPVFTRLAGDDADDVKVIVDGRFAWRIGEEHVLEVQAAEKPLLLVCSPNKGYFEILRGKLNWGGRSPAMQPPFSAP